MFHLPKVIKSLFWHLSSLISFNFSIILVCTKLPCFSISLFKTLAWPLFSSENQWPWWQNRLLIAKSNKCFLTSHQVSWLHFSLLMFFQFFCLLSCLTHYAIRVIHSKLSVTMSHFIFSLSRLSLTPCPQRERGHHLDTSRWSESAGAPPGIHWYHASQEGEEHIVIPPYLASSDAKRRGSAHSYWSLLKIPAGMRLLIHPWLGEKRLTHYCSQGWKSRISTWPLTLKEASLLCVDTKSPFPSQSQLWFQPEGKRVPLQLGEVGSLASLFNFSWQGREWDAFCSVFPVLFSWRRMFVIKCFLLC